MEQVRAAMEPSLASQRDSVRKQSAAAAAYSTAPRADPFYTIPWPDPFPSTAAGFDCKAIPDKVVNDLVTGAATAETISPDLIRAVMWQESGNRPCAISPKGALGLMQLMPSTAEEFAVDNPFDAKQSVQAGARLLKQLLKKYGGNVMLALSAYNAGSKKVDTAKGIPDIPETRNYVFSILGKLPK